VLLNVLNVCDGWIQEREGFYILARQIFRKVMLLDESWLLVRWTKSGAVLRKMFNAADKLINIWEAFDGEFTKNTTLENKAMLVPMMYAPWDLCDETFARWNKDNPIAWHDLKTLRATSWTHSVYMYVLVYVCFHIHI